MNLGWRGGARFNRTEIKLEFTSRPGIPMLLRRDGRTPIFFQTKRLFGGITDWILSIGFLALGLAVMSKECHARSVCRAGFKRKKSRGTRSFVHFPHPASPSYPHRQAILIPADEFCAARF